MTMEAFQTEFSLWSPPGPRLFMLGLSEHSDPAQRGMFWATWEPGPEGHAGTWMICHGPSVNLPPLESVTLTPLAMLMLQTHLRPLLTHDMQKAEGKTE